MWSMCEAGVGVEAGARDGDGGGDGGGVGRGCFGCEADYYYSLGHFYELLWTKVRLARFVPTIQLSRETKMRRRQAEEENDVAYPTCASSAFLFLFSFSTFCLFFFFVFFFMHNSKNAGLLFLWAQLLVGLTDSSARGQGERGRVVSTVATLEPWELQIRLPLAIKSTNKYVCVCMCVCVCVFYWAQLYGQRRWREWACLSCAIPPQLTSAWLSLSWWQPLNLCCLLSGADVFAMCVWRDIKVKGKGEMKTIRNPILILEQIIIYIPSLIDMFQDESLKTNFFIAYSAFNFFPCLYRVFASAAFTQQPSAEQLTKQSLGLKGLNRLNHLAQCPFIELMRQRAAQTDNTHT